MTLARSPHIHEPKLGRTKERLDSATTGLVMSRQLKDIIQIRLLNRMQMWLLKGMPTRLQVEGPNRC